MTARSHLSPEAILDWLFCQAIRALPARALRFLGLAHRIVDIDPKAPSIMDNLTGHPVAIRLVPGRVLAVAVAIPPVTGGEVDRIIDMQLDRTSPLRRDLVRHHALPAQKGQAVVFLVRRSDADVALAAVTAVGGRPVAMLSAEPGHEQCDFLRDDPSRRQARRLAFLLVALCLALGTALPLHALAWFVERGTVQLDIAASGLAGEAGAARKAEERLGFLEKEIVPLMAGRVAPSVLAGELAARLPDDTWLQLLEIDPEMVRFGGYSVNASALAPMLEASPIFHDARVVGPISVSPIYQREEFTLQMRMESVATPSVPGGDHATR